MVGAAPFLSYARGVGGNHDRYCLALLFVLTFGTHSRADDTDGWVLLFDGKSLDGWTHRNGTATYRIAGEAIVGKTTKGGPNSFLCTDKLYDDFELTFEVKVDNALNSGADPLPDSRRPQGARQRSAGRDRGKRSERCAGRLRLRRGRRRTETARVWG